MTHYNRMAAIVLLLLKGPRTQSEILHFLGLPETCSTGRRNTSALASIGKCLRALRNEGLVEIIGSRAPAGYRNGRRAVVWMWVGDTLTSATNFRQQKQS